ncbi:hypothetical protein CO610_07280 [Lysobacteraceae bacterium NML95-0200]|nr:hypothetical protein CO610_07280 [Xanthomonadaceae bacterium NML95-0200]
MNKLVPVAFHGQTLLATTIEGKPFVALKPIAEAIGLQWEAQFKRIKRHPVLSEGMSIMDIPSKGGAQQTVCLPLDKLNGWLFGIHASRAKPELREKLIQYQRECFDVLARHFGAADESRPYAVLPGQTLSAEQADELRCWENHNTSHACISHHDHARVVSGASKHLCQASEPPRKRGFVMPDFLGEMRLSARTAARLGTCFEHLARPCRFKTAGRSFKTHQGA